MIRLGEHATGREIPIAHEEMKASDRPASVQTAAANSALDRIYAVLPKKQQEWQVWAQSQSHLEDAEDSQRQWSEEYFGKWLATPQDGTLGTIPLVVLTRSNGQYVDGEHEISAAQLESERKEGQSKLARLSTNSRQVIIDSGHNMELEAPDQLVDALRLIVDVVRHKRKL
jgi:hypothetical protein